MAAPLTGEQLRAFEASGYALLESPLTPDQLDSAEDAFDRLIQVRQTHSQAVLSQALATDPPFVELISHPWFESVAKQLLRSEQVRLIELGPSQFRPGTGESRSADAEADNWRSGAHLDIQVSASGFDATPRQDMLACWFWVNDVPAERGAMRILPGSHRPIQEHWERTLTPEHRAMLPRHQVLRPQPSDTTQETWSNHPEYIPEPADFPFTECEPMPVVAKRGTAQFFTQSLLHSVRPPHPNPFHVHRPSPLYACPYPSAPHPFGRAQAWHNSDTQPRKGMRISWVPLDVSVGFRSPRLEDLRTMFPLLRESVARWQPGREHIVSDEEEFCHVVNTGEQWEETFFEGRTPADRPRL